MSTVCYFSRSYKSCSYDCWLRLKWKLDHKKFLGNRMGVRRLRDYQCQQRLRINRIRLSANLVIQDSDIQSSAAPISYNANVLNVLIIYHLVSIIILKVNIKLAGNHILMSYCFCLKGVYNLASILNQKLLNYDLCQDLMK